MASVKEIARRAGVSTATVSRVLNNFDSVKEENRRRVLEAVDSMGYQVNVQARSLRTSKSGSIIALIPTIRNPLFAEMLNGLLTQAKKGGYNVFVGTIEGNLENVDQYISMLYSHQADGIVFFSSTFNAQILEKLEGHFPFVLCNESVAGIEAPLVSINNEQASYDAATYLLQKGCRNLAYIAGHTTSSSTAQRIAGYKRALEEYRLPFNERSIINGSNSDFRKTPILQEFITKGDYDGFIVNSDLKAAFVLNKLIEQLHIPPDQINLVSFDGTYLADITIPPMTTITQPMLDIGALAAKMLIQLLDGKTPLRKKTRILPHHLMIRKT